MSHLFPVAASMLAAFSVQAGWCPASAPRAPSEVPASEPRAEQEWAEELPAAVLENGLSTRVEAGRSPLQSGFRLHLEGAAPRSAVCLELGSMRSGRFAVRSRQVFMSDASGCAATEVHGGLPVELSARFLARTAAGSCGIGATVSLPQSLAAPSPVQRGDIVIAEIMKDPTFVSDTHGEWFEIQNITNHPINIAGWTISDLGSNSHTLSNNGQLIVLSPGQRFVLGIDKDPLTNGGVQVDYKYSGFTLGNGADSILLTSRKGDLIDQVDYDDGVFWPDTPGKSLCLHPYFADVYLNDIPGNWCDSKTPISAANTDLGTPGRFNDTCP